MEEGLKKVVVAVDESDESMYALQWAVDNIKLSSESDSTFVLVHAQSLAVPFTGPMPFGGPALVVAPAYLDHVQQYQTQVSDAVFAHALNICKSKNVPAQTKLLLGIAKDVICDTVEQLQADLLIMGSHGYGAIKRYKFEVAKNQVMLVKRKDLLMCQSGMLIKRHVDELLVRGC